MDWYARVELFDPVTEERFPVHDGVEVSVARRDPETGRVDLDRIPLAWSDESRCFEGHPDDVDPGRDPGGRSAAAGTSAAARPATTTAGANP